MSAKIIENLPSKDLPWFRCYANGQPYLHVNDVYDKDRTYKLHFGLPMCDFMISEIAVANIQVIHLLGLNECDYLGIADLKRYAAEYKLTLDNNWAKIKNSPVWNFYYINKDSGLSRDVYDILNKILDYQIVI